VRSHNKINITVLEEILNLYKEKIEDNTARKRTIGIAYLKVRYQFAVHQTSREKISTNRKITTILGDLSVIFLQI